MSMECGLINRFPFLLNNLWPLITRPLWLHLILPRYFVRNILIFFKFESPSNKSLLKCLWKKLINFDLWFERLIRSAMKWIHGLKERRMGWKKFTLVL
jgi:hypothetical protein